MNNRHVNKINCEIYKNPNFSWLEKTWLELEGRSDTSIFLSWLWVGTWIESFVTDFFVVEARKSNKTVGLGIFVTSTDKLFGFPFKRRYFLHRTGVRSHDQIWIEYNDFLLDQSDEVVIRSAMLEYCIYNLSSSASIVIGASEENKFNQAEHLGLIKRTLWQTQNFALDLNELRDNKQSTLQYLSRNTRYQILRSIRKYESQYGEIKVEKASSLKRAKEMLQLAKPLHLARWNRKNDKSGFANTEFLRFHEKIITKGIKSENVELYHIKAGDVTLSVMYNFKHNNKIFFYLCAINYENHSSQFKPGLVSHYLLIKKALEEGVDLYDFMGGFSRYKKSFSNIEGQLTVNIYESADWKLNLEQTLRNSKLKLKNKLPQEIEAVY